MTIKESQTDRPTLGNNRDNGKVKESVMWNTVEESGDTKQLIRRLLNKNKSQKKLVKINEVRDRFKEEKERSRSKTSRIKQIPSPLKDK